MNKRTLKTAVFFSALVFVILVATMFLNVLFTMAMFRSGILDVQHRESSLIFFAIISVIIGMIISKFVARRPIGSIVEISEATKEIARGNFNVQMNEDIRVTEIQTMARNFNLMVRELAATEILRNDFVENVSHEFKTPLTAIEGYAMLLQDSALSPAEREEYLNKILFNTHRLSTLVGNILLLSKMESKSLSEQSTCFRLDEQLRQAVVALEPQWTEKDISFDAVLDPVTVTGCERLLSQVWTNLIGNAIKFSDAGQEIAIRLLEQTECVVVSIRDHGCGMTPEVQAHIFEKFYQGDTSRRSMGNGLGLALVKRIVELSQGVIEVDSAPGEGSTFRVILPK